MTVFVRRRAACGIPRYHATKTLPGPRTRTNRVASSSTTRSRTSTSISRRNCPTNCSARTGKAIRWRASISLQQDEKPASNDLGKIRPPGGVPLFPVGAGDYRAGDGRGDASVWRPHPAKTSTSGSSNWNGSSARNSMDGLRSKTGMPHRLRDVDMSVAFDGLKWNAKARTSSSSAPKPCQHRKPKSGRKRLKRC